MVRPKTVDPIWNRMESYPIGGRMGLDLITMLSDPIAIEMGKFSQSVQLVYDVICTMSQSPGGIKHVTWPGAR